MTTTVSGCESGVPPSRRSPCEPLRVQRTGRQGVDGLGRQADDSPLGEGSDRLMNHVARIVTVQQVDPLGVCEASDIRNRRRGGKIDVQLVIA